MRTYSTESRGFKDKLTNTISAINTGFFGLGSILGPIMASVLTDMISFRMAFTIISAFVLLCSIIQHVALCYKPKES